LGNFLEVPADDDIGLETVAFGGKTVTARQTGQLQKS